MGQSGESVRGGLLSSGSDPSCIGGTGLFGPRQAALSLQFALGSIELGEIFGCPVEPLPRASNRFSLLCQTHGLL